MARCRYAHASVSKVERHAAKQTTNEYFFGEASTAKQWWIRYRTDTRGSCACNVYSLIGTTRTVVQQQSSARSAAASACGMEGRLAIITNSVRVGAGLKKNSKAVDITMKRGEVNRGHAAAPLPVEPQSLAGKHHGIHVTRVSAGFLAQLDEAEQRLQNTRQNKREND